MTAFYSNFRAGLVTDDPLSSSATSINSAEFADLPVVASPHYLWAVLDPEAEFGNPEIVKIVAHSSSSTTIEVVRGQQTSVGGFGAREHIAGTMWVLSWTADDADQLPHRLMSSKGDLIAASGSNEVVRVAVGDDGEVLLADSSAVPGVTWGQVDHGSTTGLGDDDHTQYLLADGTRDAAYIGFNTTSPVDVTEGQIAWNDDEGTIDIGMHGGNVVLQSGQEVVYYVKNQTGSDIPDGTVVRFDGSLGASGRLKIAPFIGNKTYKSAYIMGITTETILDGEDGYVTHFGKVRGLDTTEDSEGNALNDGDLLYASATVPGGYTRIEPEAPNNRVLLAAVVSVHSQNGVLFVRPTFVADLLENERVNAPDVADNDVLVYNGSTGVFQNEPFDHGGLSGLADDDHTQYLRVDGSRSASSITVDDGDSSSSISLTTTTSSTTDPLLICSVVAECVKFIIHVSDSGGGRQVSEVLAVQDGLDILFTEYGVLSTTPGLLSSIEVEHLSGEIRLIANPVSSGLVFKVHHTSVS